MNSKNVMKYRCSSQNRNSLERMYISTIRVMSTGLSRLLKALCHLFMTDSRQRSNKPCGISQTGNMCKVSTVIVYDHQKTKRSNISKVPLRVHKQSGL